MSLKLRIASFWMPQSLLIAEIDRVAEVTLKCLDQLLEKYATLKLNSIQKEEPILKGDIGERRKIMAEAHNIRVQALFDTLGGDDALKIGRKALFKAGLKLGRETRKRLGVGNNLQDLIRAARVLYRVLGIEFQVTKSGNEISLLVKKCFLSNYYTPETCKILSAADEGVIQGLNENIKMIFTQRMTEGASECVACISCKN